MVKITPKVRTILLSLLLIGSYFTTYANAISSFLTPPETDTRVSIFKVSAKDESPNFQNLFENFSQVIEEHNYLDFSKHVSYKLNPYSVSLYFKSNFKKKIQSNFSHRLILSKPLNSFEKISNSNPCDNDNVKPTVAVQNVSIYLDGNGDASTTAAAIDNGSVDNCSAVSLLLSKTTFDCSNVGPNTVTLTVTDVDGNSDTANATVTVVDNVVPTVITKNLTVQLDATGSATITASDVNNGSNDACGIKSLTVSPSSFTCANIGTNSVILTVTDNNNNVSTKTAIVTVVDNVVPTVITKNLTVQLDATGSAKITASDVDNKSNDACGIKSLTVSPSSFTCANIGTNTVTLTVTDNNNNVSTKTAIVTVVDNVVPTVITKNLTVQLDAIGSATITASDVDNGSNDACGIQSLSVGPSSFTCANIGTNTVTLTVTDNNNNVSTKTAIVTVVDNVVPTVITKNLTVQLDATGSATITASDVDNGSNDACGIQSMTVSPSSFTCANIGTNTVTLTVTDNNNNVSTKTAIVTVIDNVVPTVITKNLTVQLDATGSATITASDVDNGSNDACGIQSMTVSPSSFTCANIGTNTVTLTVTDTNNNVSTKTAIVTVEDVTPPNIPVLQNIIWGCEYTVTPPTTTDTCDTNVTVTASRSTTFSSSGTIIWTFTDDSNNSSQSIEQTITINPISVSIEKTDILCYGASTGEVEAIITGGVAPFTYDWGDQGAGSKKTGLAPGNYSVIVTDANGCKATKQTTITEPETFVKINNVSIFTGCNGDNNASISIDAEGGTGILNYYLDGIQLSDNTASGLSQINHTVEVIDSNGCSVSKEVIIEEPEILTITNVKTTETNGYGSATGSATVFIEGGVNPYSFTWLDDTDNSIGQSGQTAQNLEAGTYKVIVTDANNCSMEPEIFTIYDSLEGEISVSSICMGDGGTQELRTSYIKPENVRGGTGNYTLTWNFDGPLSITGPDSNGVYTVKYSNVGTKNLELTITDNVNRFDNNGNIISHKATLDLYVGECFGKCTAQDLDVGEYYIGDINTGVPIGENCDGTPRDVAIWVYLIPPSDNAARYNFYREYVINVYNVTTDSLYTLNSVDDNTGASGICVTGRIDASKPHKITNVLNYNCNTESILLEKLFVSVSTGNNGGNCNVYSESNNPKCSGLDEPKVVPSPLAVSAAGTQVLCISSPNGQVAARAVGNQGTLQFTLQSVEDPTFILNSPVQNSSKYTFSGLPVGLYDITVSDNIGNNPELRAGKTDEVVNIQVTSPDTPLELAEVTNTRVELACSNGNNAEVEVSATGGKAPYIYTWEDGRTGNRNTNLSAGTTWVKAIDDNGCEKTLIVEIVAPPEVIANAGTDVDFNCGISKVELAAIFPTYLNPVTNQEGYGEWTILNGAAGATFSDKNSPNSIFTIITSGSYTLQWTVPCGSTDTVKITFKNCSTLDFDGVDDHIDLGDNYNPTSTYTMETWIRPLNLAGIRTILSKRDNSNLSKGGFDLIIDNSYPKFRWNGSSSITSNHPIDADRWYHVAVIIGGNNAGLYVDGIKVSAEAPGTPMSVVDRFLIGAGHTSTDLINPENFFNGWIEEVRIWDTSLTQRQLQFLMNQRVKLGITPVQGTEIPNQDAYGLSWSNLKGYYRLIATDVVSGYTKDLAQENTDGRLVNIISTQKNTAPLPYITAKDGNWDALTTWAQPNDWDVPNSLGINNESINWNIVEIRPTDKITYAKDNKELKLLGLIADGNLNMSGTNQSNLTLNNGTGSGLNISKYFELNGVLDLDGESQLVQPENSQLVTGPNGYLMRDQQGTANSYNYNYWSSPVNINNTGKYTVVGVMKDGTIPNLASKNQIPNINFGDGVTFADGALTTPRKISNRWIYKFQGKADEYSAWSHLGSNGELKTGEGYTMKGTSGSKNIQTPQNYTFIGVPNNDPYNPATSTGISLPIGKDQNYLIGNPYPSAINAEQFILDNLNVSNGGNNTQNQFNGALYFWDHFAGKSHDLAEYIGGYATFNLSGGVPAIATDDRINSTGGESTKKPGSYIPVGQGFFISTVLDSELSNGIIINPTKITFKNSQRLFQKETSTAPDPYNNSQFLKPTVLVKGENSKVENSKIRLDFISPMGYRRQILVGTNPHATNGFDIGYDAPLNDYNVEDMFWIINGYEFVIQGVNNFNPEQILPLGLGIKEKGIVTVKINSLNNINDNVQIYLRDKDLDLYTDLRDTDYIQEIEGGDYYERYEIVFQKEEESTPALNPSTEELEEEEVETPLLVIDPNIINPDTELEAIYISNDHELAIVNPNSLQINKVVLYNTLGQELQRFMQSSNNKEIRLPVREYPTAIYAVRIYSAKGEFSKNIIMMR